MPDYVDTTELESDWFNWVIAKSVPKLSPYREIGCLWTRVGTVPGTRGRKIPDPYNPVRYHCLAIGGSVLEVSSHSGVVLAPMIRNQEPLAYKLPLEWSIEEEVKYARDHDQRNPADAIDGFFLEKPVRQSWEALASKIWLICSGVADYHLPTTDELYDLRDDMVNEVAAQVFSKLKFDKLKYRPGQAPVFNLLSTAIHNLCYSFMAKESRRLANKQKLIHEAWNGRSPFATCESSFG